MGAGSRHREPLRRGRRPDFERLEGRELPSGLHVMGRVAQPHPNIPSLNLVLGSLHPAGQLTHPGPVAPRPRWVNQNYINSLASTLYAPVTTTQPIAIGGQVFPPGTYITPQPTPFELRRETFWTEFTGRYSVGPPRFSNQSATIHIYSNGRNVVSNWFSQGRAEILLLPPADPTATPTTLDPVAGQVTGVAEIVPANYLQSSNQILIDVNNLPGVASNDPGALQHGLPSRVGFTLDSAGSGAFTTPAFAPTPAVQTDPATGQPIAVQGGAGGVVAYTQGMGLIEISYHPDGRLRAGASQSGTVSVRIQGLVNESGSLNPVYKGIN